MGRTSPDSFADYGSHQAESGCCPFPGDIIPAVYRVTVETNLVRTGAGSFTVSWKKQKLYGLFLEIVTVVFKFGKAVASDLPKRSLDLEILHVASSFLSKVCTPCGKAAGGAFVRY